MSIDSAFRDSAHWVRPLRLIIIHSLMHTDRSAGAVKRLNEFSASLKSGREESYYCPRGYIMLDTAPPAGGMGLHQEYEFHQKNRKDSSGLCTRLNKSNVHTLHTCCPSLTSTY